VKYTNLSADSHLSTTWFPKDLYQSRLPAKLREAGPKVVETDEGTKWEWEGVIHGAAADGNDLRKHASQHFRSSREADAEIFDIGDGKLGSDPDVMLEHMDLDGTYAAVYYGETRKEIFKDPELEIACHYAVNEWAVETSSKSPDRLIILPTLPTAYPDVCAAEVYRLAEMGTKAVEFVLWDAAEPVFEEIWEPVWAAAEETNIVICSHIGDKKGTPRPPFRRGARLAHYPQVPMVIVPHLGQLIFSGVFERHPKLRYSFGECRIGWIPFVIQWMDRTAKGRSMQTDTPLSMLPSEYIKRQITFTFEEDYVGTKMLMDPEFYIRDSAVWGSDYPHEQGTWPHSEETLDRLFEGVDDATRRTVVWDRTAAFFDIKGPEAEAAK
jgi:predicted TIM-barrel fold metal-dependent hydrolase